MSEFDIRIGTLLDTSKAEQQLQEFVNKHNGDNGGIDLIMCKHISDSVRFYNMLESWIKRDKIKQVIFVGDYSSLSDRRRKLENELLELTGWKINKIRMSTNSYFNHSSKKMLDGKFFSKIFFTEFQNLSLKVSDSNLLQYYLILISFTSIFSQ